MSDEKMKLEEIEPSFNIDDWARELLPDSSFSNDTSGFPVSSPFPENSVQQNNSLQIAGSSQVSTANTNMNSSMTRNPANTSGSMLMDGVNNPVGGFSSSSSSVHGGLAPNQSLSYMISQIDQYQHRHHQVRAQLGEMPNTYTSSARLGAHNLSNQIQQQQNQSTASAMLQQQRSTGHQSPSRLMMRRQDSCNYIQQADQPNLEQKLQKASRQVQMQQTVNMQSGLLSEHAQPKLMASAFPQSQPRNSQMANQIMYENQPQQFQGHPQVQMPMPDWVHQAFLQITQLKSLWLHTVETNYRNYREQRNQAQNNETASKLESTILFYVQMLTFLRMSKSDIQKHGKEKIYWMIRYFKTYDPSGAKNSLHVQQAQQNDASFSQMTTPQLHHRAIAPQYYGTLPNIPGPLRQKRPLSLDASPASSFQVGSSVGVQMPGASSNQHSLTRSTQSSPSQVPQRVSISSPHEGSKLGFEQRSPAKHPQSSSGVPRQFAFTAQPQKVATTSRKRFNPLESSSNEKNNNLNIAKSAQQSLSVEQMQQIMQKRNSSSPLRHFVGFNKSSSSPLSIPSPQNSQHSSRTPPSLANSPLTFPSPLNPLTPISKATDPEFSSISHEASNKAPMASPALVQPPKRNEPVMEGLGSSPLVTEPSIPDKADSSHDAQTPINRLLNAVKTISHAALQSSVQDITAIMEMNDRMTVFRHGERTMDIVKDLSGDVRTHNNWNFASTYGTGMESRMKRELDSIGWMPEKEHLASDMVKWQMKEPNEELLREIKETNTKLMEVIVNARAGNDEESSIVRCSYCPIGHYGKDIPNTSPETFPYLALELKVMNDYPRSSPIILESQPPSCSESEKGKELWQKAMSDFSSAIRAVEQPISLHEMAKTWGICARRVYVDYAVQNGGGTFTTKYGEWQSV